MNRQQRRADKKNHKPTPARFSARVQALFDEATRFHQSGQLGRAEPLYREILQLEPRHFDALHLLGLIARQAGHLDAAEDLIRRAVTENGRDPGFHTNLGNVLRERGRPDEAEAAFLLALKASPNFVPAHFNLANLLREQGKLSDAASHFGKILALQPGNLEARSNLGLILRDLGRTGEARSQFEQALAYRPDYAEAHCNLALLLLDAGETGEAAATFRKVLTCSPSLSEAHNGLGAALKKGGQVPLATPAFARATSVNPLYAEAYSNLGLALKERARLDDAILSFDRALAIYPNLAEARFGRGLALLQKGDWARGWDDYEFRWLQSGQTLKMRTYPQPLWRGDPPQGRTLFLWSEQAFGDAIQFARFAPEMAQRGWRVILETRPEVKRLLQGLKDVIVVADGEKIPPFDVHYPLQSIPRLLSITPQTLPPTTIPVNESWGLRGRDILGPKTSLRIGVNWRGHAANSREIWRAASAVLFGSFLDLPGVEIVNLQKDATPGELSVLGGAVRNVAADLVDFADTAGIVANLDLVITVDTAMAHLAGAIGAPTWVLLDFASDWQWLSKRRDSPWYPSARLFRQPAPGDWPSVMNAVRTELTSLQSA